MKIKYTLETPWPTDVANPDGLEALDWFQYGEIPFLPALGMEIDCGDGDFRAVRNVYWNVSHPDTVEVFFEDEMERKLDYWTSGGWQTHDLPKVLMRKRAAPRKGVSRD